jgi:hypothetical protein
LQIALLAALSKGDSKETSKPPLVFVAKPTEKTMIVADHLTDPRLRTLVKYVGRRWRLDRARKVGAHRCPKRSCRKRRPHWHWRLTSAGFQKMLRRVYTEPLMDMLNAPNPIMAMLEKANAPLSTAVADLGRPIIGRIGLPSVRRFL